MAKILESLKVVTASYIVIILFHATDLNPIWYWEWYRKTVGGFLIGNARILILSLIIAILVFLLVEIIPKKRVLQP